MSRPKATRFAEQSGHGIPIIVSVYGRDAFSFDDGMLKVSLPLGYETSQVSSRKDAERREKTLTRNARSIMDFFREHPTATIQMCADSIGLSISGTKKILGSLQNAKLIRREGSRRDSKWIVFDQIS